MNDLSIKPKQVLLGMYRKEIWDNYQFTIIELFAFDRFFNWALSDQMSYIENKDTRFFLIDYKTIAPSWGMSVIYLKKIMLHLSGSLPKDTSTNLKYPLIRITQQSKNNKWFSYFGFEKGVMNTIISWETINPNRKVYLEAFVNNNGLFSPQELIALNPPKQDKNKIICKLLPKVESILIELNKLQINDRKTLFSFPKPIDHFVHTASIQKFQSYLQDLHEGLFIKNNRINDEFIERNNYYINDKSYAKIKECKGDWDKIYELLIVSANHFLTWFEEGREPQSKGWLKNYRHIDCFMFDIMSKNSMFLATLLKDSSSLREVIAENMYNKLPSYISTKFQNLYNDEWDGLSYWKKIHDVYKWYLNNHEDLIEENNNYRYWFQSVNDFMDGYYDFINMLNGTKYLKHFGTKCPTWNYFINMKKQEHGIEEK
jgi:hypothetical protein